MIWTFWSYKIPVNITFIDRGWTMPGQFAIMPQPVELRPEKLKGNGVAKGGRPITVVGGNSIGILCTPILNGVAI